MYIAIGKITRTHGTAGYMEAIPYSDLPERFQKLKTLYIENEFGMQGFIVEDVQISPRKSLLKFKGLDEREAVRFLAGKEIWVPEVQKIDLPDDTYFIHDLIGLKVFDIHGHYIGRLEEVFSNAGNDIYRVKVEDKEVLLPAVSQFIKKINLKEKKMIVELIEGMLE
ncbi:MAG: 16S rRNA processing protein RimM [Calditrichae bacterium]|nr:16S rRNA processing protein RimM [Calditrichia bacterium]